MVAARAKVNVQNETKVNVNESKRTKGSNSKNKYYVRTIRNL